MMPDDDTIDFDAAELFLRNAREAHEVGDRNRFVAARKLVAVALRITEALPLRTAHLRETDGA